MLNGIKVIAIAAVSLDGVIGINKKIPWNIPEDFKHFKNTTMGNIIIMGYNTFETFPAKAFKGREYIVLIGKNPHPEDNGNLYCFRKLSTILHLLWRDENNFNKIFIAGGAMVYETFMKYLDEAIITWVNKTYPEGNKKFPIDELFANFVVDEAQSHDDWQQSTSGLLYKIMYYTRIT
jgi:dihydrofolate reductase